MEYYTCPLDHEESENIKEAWVGLGQDESHVDKKAMRSPRGEWPAILGRSVLYKEKYHVRLREI